MIEQEKLLSAVKLLRLFMDDSLLDTRLKAYAAAYNQVLDELWGFYGYPINDDNTVFDIIGVYSGDVIGKCIGYDSILNVLLGEPKAMFRKSTNETIEND